MYWMVSTEKKIYLCIITSFAVHKLASDVTPKTSKSLEKRGKRNKGLVDITPRNWNQMKRVLEGELTQIRPQSGMEDLIHVCHQQNRFLRSWGSTRPGEVLVNVKGVGAFFQMQAHVASAGSIYTATTVSLIHIQFHFFLMTSGFIKGIFRTLIINLRRLHLAPKEIQHFS